MNEFLTYLFQQMYWHFVSKACQSLKHNKLAFGGGFSSHARTMEEGLTNHSTLWIYKVLLYTDKKCFKSARNKEEIHNIRHPRRHSSPPNCHSVALAPSETPSQCWRAPKQNTRSHYEILSLFVIAPTSLKKEKLHYPDDPQVVRTLHKTLHSLSTAEL